MRVTHPSSRINTINMIPSTIASDEKDGCVDLDTEFFWDLCSGFGQAAIRFMDDGDVALNA
jgi:hypothetical protein